MKKVIVSIVLCGIILMGLTGCKITIHEDSLKFKEEYESLNGKKSASGSEYRTISINENNPFRYISAEDIVKKIENKETFYLYIGDKQCPWCRSSIEKGIKVANEKKIDIIYYVNIWDDDHNEILRDKYIINDKNKLELVNKGTEAYYKLLDYFKDYLRDYTLKDKKDKDVNVGEKRIFAPNYFYVEKGKLTRFVSSTSKKQENSNDELTKEILDDQEKQFKELFK